MPKLIKKSIVDRRYRLLTIILVFICLIIFTYSFSLISSLVNGVSMYVSGGKNELIILSSSSSTPFTGLVNLNLIENISRVRNVYAVSPELPVPVYVNGSPVILRGVDPRHFVEATDIKILDGVFLDGDDYNHVVVGRDFATHLNIKVGDKLIVAGVIRKSFGYFIVDGVFDAPEPYNSEVLTILPIARVFRGVNRNFSGLIRVVAEQGSYNTVKKDIQDILLYANNTSCLGCESGNIVGSSSEAVGFYLHKYGLDINALYIALIPPIIVSLFSIKYLVGGILDRHRLTIKILHNIGYSYKLIRLNYMIQIIIHILPASIVGFLAGVYLMKFLWRIYDIRFLIHIPLAIPFIEILVLGLILFTSITIYYFYSGWRIDEEL